MSLSVAYAPFVQMLDACYDRQPFDQAQKLEFLQAFAGLPEHKELTDIKALSQKVDDLILRLEMFSSEVSMSYEQDRVLRMDKKALKERLEAKRHEVYGLKQKLGDTKLLLTFESGRTLNLLNTDMEQVNAQFSSISAADREADTELTILEEAYDHADDPLYVPLRHKTIEQTSHKITVLKAIREHCQNQLLIAMLDRA